MISKITLEVDREFLEGYRTYKVNEILDDNNESKYAYTLLAEFIDKSTYNLNRLFEEMSDDVKTITLDFDKYDIKKSYKPIEDSELFDDLFDFDE